VKRFTRDSSISWALACSALAQNGFMILRRYHSAGAAARVAGGQLRTPMTSKMSTFTTAA